MWIESVTKKDIHVVPHPDRRATKKEATTAPVLYTIRRLKRLAIVSGVLL